jgi:GNAT superfamily N-acetyltransferase
LFETFSKRLFDTPLIPASRSSHSGKPFAAFTMFRLFDSAMLRLATPADIPALTTLIERSVHGLHHHAYTDSQRTQALGTVFGVDTQLIADGTYYVVLDGDAIVACGGWSYRSTLFGPDAHKTGLDNRLDPLQDAARIRAFFVDPTHARKGLGKQILETCLRAATDQGFKRFALAATLPGIPFYRRMGFRDGETLYQTLSNGEPLPLMHMVLDIAETR